MLVGTAITGLSTRPATTLRRAPSIPAPTVSTAAARRGGFDPRDQHVVRAVGEAARDLDDLLGRLPRREDHFGVAGAQGTMMIDLGKTEIVERQGLELLERRVGADTAGTHFREQF